jgi:hypothetical protein
MALSGNVPLQALVTRGVLPLSPVYSVEECTVATNTKQPQVSSNLLWYSYCMQWYGISI